MPSSSNPSKPRVDGLAVLREWGSESPPDHDGSGNKESEACYRFNLTLPRPRRLAITGIDPTRLPMV